MNKPLFVISSPYDTFSGYGARSRDLIKAIIELDKYEVKLIPQRWGETPWGFTDDHSEWTFLKQYILNAPLNQQPEIWMQITVPNEFQPMGKYSIGVTAGIETTACSHEFLEGVNRMNLTLVSSEHTKKVFEDTKFEKVNQQTGAREGSIVLDKPIEVLFEGANTDIYKVLDKIETTEDSFINSLDSIPESFAYLFVGHWMQGQIGEDRKNVGLLIKAFYEMFKNKSKAPALILKTSMVGSSTVDREELLKRIKLIRKTVKASTLPNIYLLHGEFTDEEMNQLYNHKKVKAMVNLTKGEGFGRPLLEFSLSKKPIITTDWSGHTDFLSKEFTILLPGQLTPVHPSAANTMLLKESNWFSVDQGQVGFYLKDVFENYKKYTDNANRQAYKSKTEFSWNKMKDKLDEIFTKNIPDFPKQMDLKLPQLKKIELPKLTKIENNG